MKRIYYLFLLLILIVLSIIFEQHKTINQKPQSLHMWRQSDCASMALTYANKGLKFFKPQMHNRQQSNGYHVGEFPGLYYLWGIGHKIFGQSEVIPRGANLLIFYLGLFALFRIAWHFSKDLFISFALPILFFSAPALMHYSNTYIPDVPAFSLILIGWACWLNYEKRHRIRWLYIAFAFFTLAGLLKITQLMSVVALGGMFALELLNWTQFKKDKKLVKHPWHFIGAFTALILIIGAWYAYSIYYNKLNGSNYFLNETNSIWSSGNIKDIKYTLKRTFIFWPRYYFFSLSNYLIIFSFLVVLIARKYNYLFTLSMLSFTGFLMIYLLWFYQFTVHDYYIINGYIFAVFILLAAFNNLKIYKPKIPKSYAFKIGVSIFLALNIYHARSTVYDRYHDGKFHEYFNWNLYDPELKSYLEDLNIGKNDLVISVPDFTPNNTLYILDQPGFTSWKTRNGPNINETLIRQYIQQGAQYLIVNNKEYLNKPFMTPFTNQKIGQYKDILIYDLKQ